MKKLFAILLAATLVASMAMIVSAANTTTLTTTVPGATYTLNIPADQEIPFGKVSTKIGELSVTNASGFADGKNLNVTLIYSAFQCADVATTIPFNVVMYADAENFREEVMPNSALTFYGQKDGSVLTYCGTAAVPYKYMHIKIDSLDWGKALAGEYTATITFTAEVVVE